MMENNDLIAKNLLENKICNNCKYYNNVTFKCHKIPPIETEHFEDIEVFINGILIHDAYVIIDNKIHLLQHVLDTNVNGELYTTNTQTPYGIITVIIRYIKDNKLKKIVKTFSDSTSDIPEQRTCLGFINI